MLDEWCEEFSRELGADYYGVADITDAGDFIFKQGQINIEQYPRAISIGMLLLDSIVDDLPRRFEQSVAVNYHHTYNILNLQLDTVASRLARSIQKQGYMALPVPASERFDDERICAVFSHKLAANLAGLGWIGKSCLLITPENGPRVRWTTILTNAPLNPTGKPIKNRCGDCMECVDICPVKAFTGSNFNENEDRDVRYDARKCEVYLDNLEKQGKLPVCGLCIYNCPFGK
ncbi:MAG: epoxyqueuosine reductase [Methanobacterium sp.]|nr:epoxyqueuosine reductase [Methanobacterium sp.]